MGTARGSRALPGTVAVTLDKPLQVWGSGEQEEGEEIAMGDLRRRHSTAGGWMALAQKQEWSERALMALAEPREALGRLCPLLPPGCLSDVL